MKAVFSLRLAFGLFAALTFTLCAGSVWAAAALWVEAPLAGMVLPCAAVAVFASHWVPLAQPGARALASLLLTVLACAYAQYLLACVAVARALGLPLLAAARHMGADMAWSLVWARMPAQGVALLCAAALLAAVAAYVTHARRPFL